MKDVRFCRCKMPAFLWSDGIWRCVVGHVVFEDIDEHVKAELGGGPA